MRSDLMMAQRRRERIAWAVRTVRVHPFMFSYEMKGTPVGILVECAQAKLEREGPLVAEAVRVQKGG